MKIKDTRDLIAKKNYAFEISSNEPGKGYGKQRLQSVEDLHGSFEDYVRKLAKLQNSQTLGIQLFQPNGTSYIKKDFFLLLIEPIVDATKTVDASTKTVDT